MLFDNAICYREAKACTRANFFGGKKRIEDTLFQAWGYTQTGIRNSDIHHVSIDRTGDGNGLERHIGQSIASVREEINKDLFQLDRIADDDNLRQAENAARLLSAASAVALA